MTCSRLAISALAAGLVLAGAAQGKKRLLPLTSPAPPRPASLAAVSDPAEPPVTADVGFADEGAALAPGQARQAVAAAGGARGTTLTLPTPTSWRGTAWLHFKGAAPPMRFSLRLTRMPSYDLEALTLTAPGVSLAVGHVSASPTTKYFDARGRALEGPEGAAYTVTARRWDGEVDVEVRRKPGAALGRAFTVTWRGNLGHNGLDTAFR